MQHQRNNKRNVGTLLNNTLNLYDISLEIYDWCTLFFLEIFLEGCLWKESKKNIIRVCLGINCSCCFITHPEVSLSKLHLHTSTCIYIFISWLHQQWNLAKKVSCIRSWITEKRKECLICFVTVECSNKVYTASIGYPRVPRVPQKTQGARMTQAQSTLGHPSAPGGHGNQVTSSAWEEGARVPQGGLVNSTALRMPWLDYSYNWSCKGEILPFGKKLEGAFAPLAPSQNWRHCR